jgi:hypothetical protein
MRAGAFDRPGRLVVGIDERAESPDGDLERIEIEACDRGVVLGASAGLALANASLPAADLPIG